MKTIAVLTSGGDAPGMNAAIRAVVRAAVAKGMTVKGVVRGYNGLIEDQLIDLDMRSVSDIIHRGGTILYTARSPLFKTEEGINMAVETCKKHRIEGVVVIGGDGSFRGARDLSLKGIPCIGVPATIDNDISSTEYTIGYDTAMNTAMEMVDRLRDTTQSHDRCSIVEVMGRHAGYLALQTGISCGATSIIVPEVEYDINQIATKMKQIQKTGKKHFIVVVAEGVGGVDKLAKQIEELTGIEARATVLGHVQRGGAPTARDRVMASQMACEAVELLGKEIGNRVICLSGGRLIDRDIYEALAMPRIFDIEEYERATTVSI